MPRKKHLTLQELEFDRAKQNEHSRWERRSAFWDRETMKCPLDRIDLILKDSATTADTKMHLRLLRDAIIELEPKEER